MSENDMFTIKVPASTANLGPGFDSLGLALDLYLTIDVARSDKWEVIPVTEEMKQFPTDETHLICQVALNTAKHFKTSLTPCKIFLKSDIPLARGLGSSAAAIVAGIELANVIGNLQLTNARKLELANKYEGHPDNVGAAIYGGLVVGTNINNNIYTVTTDDIKFEAVVVIPNEELLTTTSREVLPKQLSFEAAVEAGTIANVLVAALFSNDFSLAGKMMKEDRYHQPYRTKLVPLFSEIERVGLENGAFGVALSGAGPTVICFCESGRGNTLQNSLQNEFTNCIAMHLEVDKKGSKVILTNELVG